MATPGLGVRQPVALPRSYRMAQRIGVSAFATT